MINSIDDSIIYRRRGTGLEKKKKFRREKGDLREEELG